MDRIAMPLLTRLLDPVLLLRVFYLGASALILIIQAVPPLRNRFLAYGSRATSPQARPPSPQGHTPSSLDGFLDYAATLRVPHSYFTHFYLLSVLCSLLWAYAADIPNRSSLVQASWCCMLVQGCRRLTESYAYPSSSKSQMWFGHWILGLVFYLTVNIAIWIEDIDDAQSAPHFSSWKLAMPISPSGLSFWESCHWKLALLIPAIGACHLLQHSYHKYLYELRTSARPAQTTTTSAPKQSHAQSNSTYQLPSHPFFPGLLCPHYTCETLIYLLLSFLATRPGQNVNGTLFCAAILVAVNLGVTANGTKKWYEENFGVERVRGRKAMVPWVW